MGDTMMY
jgi:hypothetical protein